MGSEGGPGRERGVCVCRGERERKKEGEGIRGGGKGRKEGREEVVK